MGMSHFQILRPRDEDEDARRPVPWRLAEKRGGEYIVVDADNMWVATVPNEQIGAMIVMSVHEYAENMGHRFDTKL